ncbi:GNAT family N-acetyltransferase [Xanthomonadaceae bacterium JHOS43]|nr:GNAT family N-acetyltransferase [Xanthomonadaceae bacterium JHOS43]
MTPQEFHVRFARYPEDLPQLRAVREPVFIVEQAVPPELEWDELDPVSVHVLACDTSGAPVGTARLTPDHTIGRMAVLPTWRGQGVAAAMLETLIERAVELGYSALELHAQTHAIGLYERFDFEAFGPEYEEAGIPHRSMRRALPSEPIDRTLRETDSAHELGALTLSILGHARRQLAIYTRDLDPTLLGTPDAIEALRRFVTGTRDAHVRILAHDLRRAVRESHGIIALTQRLPSRISIRVIEDEPDTQYAAAFTLNDRGYVFRPNATRSEASACFHDPARQRQLLGYFNEVWERARPASELRPL